MSLNVEECVLEEIALEGLEGITLSSLWVRLSVVPNFTLDVNDEKVHHYLWNGVIFPNIESEELSCYALPTERNTIVLYNRYDHINSETGTCIEEPDNVPDDVYERVVPVTSADGKIRGSCVHFHQREDVRDGVLKLRGYKSLNDVQKQYGNKLVIVASQRRRDEVLRIPYVNPVELTPLHYCILERVGRARYQGEVTIGKESLGYTEKPKTMFYYRKKLIKHGLLRKQAHIIYEQKTGFNRHGLLLLLPRFYATRLTPMAIAARKINDILVNQPNLEIDYNELKDKLGVKKKMYRHVFPSYLKNFKVYETEVDSGEKSVTKRIVKLVKPLFGDEEESEEESEDDDDNEESEGWGGAKDDVTKRGRLFHPGYILADRTMLTQALNVIESCESPNGISLRDIGEKLSLPKLEVRGLARTLTKLNEITEFRVEDGRQKRTHYLPRNRSDHTLKKFDEERKNLSYNTKDTITFLKRANLVLETVKEHRIIDQFFRLKKVIQNAEKDSPYQIDQKSVQKIVQKLAVDGHVRYIKMTLECHGVAKKVHIVCDPSISADSPLIRERIEQLKFRKFGGPSEKPAPKQPLNKLYENKEKDLKLQYVPSMGRKYGLQPKMKKCLVLYKFLFHLLCTKPEADAEYDDWRQFIQHLPDGCNDEGTCTLGDVVPRLPLSVFVQIVFITYVVPGLEEILNDPVLKHHSLAMLPAEIRKYLFYKRKFVFNIVEVLTSLSYLDLVSISYKEQNPKESVIITMKHKPKITEGNVTKVYDLQTMEDVEHYCVELSLHCQRAECPNCILDKKLFAHNQRNWTYVPKSVYYTCKSKKRLNTGVSDNPQFPKRKLSADIQTLNSLKRSSLSDGAVVVNKKLKTYSNVDRKQKQVLKRISTKKSKKELLKERRAKRVKTPRAPQYDQIDLAALKLMKKWRVDWTREEDSFLLMCRVASILLDPSSPTFICVNRNVVRDELHKQFPEQSKDKTAKACQRRLSYMLKKERTRQNVNDWVIECKQDVDLMQIECPDVPRTHHNEWNEAYLTLLYALLNKFQAHHLSKAAAEGSIHVDSMQEILAKYDIIKSEYQLLPEKRILHNDPQNIVDIHLSVVLNVLMSSLMLTQMKEVTPYVTNTLFRIYQRYPDALIRSVATRLQTNGIITKIKKQTNASSLRARGSTPYRISQHYLYLLRTRMCVDSLIRQIPDKFTASDSSLNTDAMLCASLFLCGNITFNVSIPQVFLVYRNPKEKLNNASKGDDVQSPMTIDAKTTSRYALHMLRQTLSSSELDGRKTQENFYINRCIIEFSTERSVILDLTKFNKILEIQGRYVTVGVPEESESQSSVSELLAFIRAKKELGATYDQIIAFTGGAWPGEEIDEYIDASLIHRVGVTAFRLVHNDFVSPWLVYSVVYPYIESNSRPTSNATQVKFIARCWKNAHGVVNMKVLFAYLSAILSHVYINPGVTEQEMINTFRVCLPPVQILELLEMLVAVDCVTITEFESVAICSLFENSDASTKIIRHFEASASAMVYICRLKQLLQVDDAS